MDFSQVKAITIPEGNVIRILSGATVLWERTGLPAEYQEVEYIESTGTQYIDTGMVLNNGCVITLDFLIAESSVNRIIYGWRRKGRYAQPYQAMIGANASKTRYVAVGRSSADLPQCFSYGVRNKVVIDSVERQVIVNNLVVECDADFSNGKAFDENGSSEYHPYLFALNNVGTPLAISEDTRIYGYSVQYEGELLQSFVPCYRKIDKVAGMYDVVNGVFHTNAGTGEFNVGADVIVLPADYQRVEYIKSTGKQYINTNFVPNQDTTVEAVAEFNTNVTGFLYGSRVNTSEDTFSLCYVSTRESIRPDYGDTQGEFYPATLNTKYTMRQEKNKFYLDGVYKGEKPYADFTTPGSMSIFAVRSEYGVGSYVTATLYSMRIWNGDRIARDLIPCYRKIDDVAGLYDVVNNVFYTNAGTGAFITGPDV